eukprot:gene15133-17912_t
MGMPYRRVFYLGSMGVLAAIIATLAIGFAIAACLIHKRRKKTTSKRRKAAKWGFITFLLLSPLFLLISTAFGGIPWVLAAILMSILWIFGLLFILRKKPKYSSDKYHNSRVRRFFSSIKNGIKRIPWPLLIPIIFGIIAVSFITALFIDDMCVAIHPIRITTRMSRKIRGLNCKSDSVCNFILTVPDDLSTSIIANFHTHDEIDQQYSNMPASFAMVDEISRDYYFSGRKSIDGGEFVNPYQSTYPASSFRMNKMKKERRFVHWADVTSLKPGTTYYVKVGYQRRGTFHFFEERKFRTAPNDNSTINFVTGGDMAHDDHGLQLSRLAAQDEPLFAMVGGDVTYDNGFFCCYRVWDDWFKRWDRTLVTDSGYSIPIITTIGNHEAGGFHSEKKRVPFYTRFMPHQLGLNAYSSPDDRPAYHSHYIGPNLFIVAADSDVITTIPSQNDWLDNQLGGSPSEFKMAIYHIALYPCAKTGDEKITKSARKNWGPIFDRHHLTVEVVNPRTNVTGEGYQVTVYFCYSPPPNVLYDLEASQEFLDACWKVDVPKDDTSQFFYAFVWQCSIPPVYGDKYRLVSKGAGSVADNSNFFQLMFPVPLLSSIISTSTRGDNNATLYGRNLIYGNQRQFSLYFKDQVINITSIVDDSQASVVIPPGIGSVDIFITIDGRVSNNVTYQYSSPTITSVEFGKNSTLTIVGDSFGDNAALISISGVPTTSFILLEPHKTIVAHVTEYTTFFNLSIVVDGQESNQYLVSSDIPFISRIYPVVTTSGGVVTVDGINFLESATSLVVNGAKIVALTSIPTRATFHMPYGQGVVNCFIETLNKSAVFPYTYAVPEIDSVSSNGTLISVQGRSFGRLLNELSIQGIQGLENLQILEADQTIRFKIPPTNYSLSFTITYLEVQVL